MLDVSCWVIGGHTTSPSCFVRPARGFLMCDLKVEVAIMSSSLAESKLVEPAAGVGQ